MRLEAELHMRALARKQKRDLAAQAAVGTGLAASEHGDGCGPLGWPQGFCGGGPSIYAGVVSAGAACGRMPSNYFSVAISIDATPGAAHELDARACVC